MWSVGSFSWSRLEAGSHQALGDNHKEADDIKGDSFSGWARVCHFTFVAILWSLAHTHTGRASCS